MRRKPSGKSATVLALTVGALGCQSGGGSAPHDPSRAEIVLDTSAPGWRGRLLLDTSGAGVWRADVLPVGPRDASPAVVALDDRGRAWVLIPDNGLWSCRETVHDRGWLGALGHGDVDPRLRGTETYVGGEAGDLFLVRAHDHGAIDARWIAHVDGREIQTIVAADLDPFEGDDELLVFTQPGGVWRVTPGGPHGTFVSEWISDLDGHVHDAVVLPFEVGKLPQVATASRSGALELVSLRDDGLERTVVFQADVGIGRVALAPSNHAREPVLYSSLDDGRVLRHERVDNKEWRSELVYLGPRGPRGLVAGRFDEDPTVETLAVFGLSGRVELLSRTEEGWRGETLYEDSGPGHWLAKGELDGRNGTDEILACGHSGKVVLLGRDVGYGVELP